jgi:mono/diheme cytochrome c family protein
MRKITVIALGLALTALGQGVLTWSHLTRADASDGAAADTSASGGATPDTASSPAGRRDSTASSADTPDSSASSAKDATAAPGAAKARSEPKAATGDPVAGKKIFKEKCVACHKVDGSGGIKLTGNPTPNWRDAKRMSDPKHNDAYLRDCITNGKPKSGMVAWSKQGVKPAQIENLIAYIRTFSQAKK